MLQRIVQGSRYLAIICCCVLGFVTIVATGGGGGGGVDVTPTPAPLLPETVTFNISAPSATAEGVILSASINQPPPELPLEISLKKPAPPGDFRVSGTHNRTTGETTITPPSGVLVDTGALFGTLTVSISPPQVRWVGTEFPVEGAMRVDFVDPNTQLPDFVLMQVDPNAGGLGIAGVSLQLSGDAGPPPTLLTWDQFINIGDDLNAEPWQVIASFGYGGYDFLFQRAAVAFDSFEFFVENSTAIETAGAAGTGQSCDVFPPATGTAGETRMIGIDANQSGDLNGGDAFNVFFNDCWVDEPLNNIDTMFRGRVGMVGYVENATPLFLKGDFIFDNFIQVETTSAPFQEDPTSTITTNGGFSLQLTP